LPLSFFAGGGAGADVEKFGEEFLKDINTSAALGITGELVASQGSGQVVELNATEIVIHGKADPDKYPIQPKKHSLEFLRENAHLRFCTATFSAFFRIRHAMAFAIHNYFNRKGFVYLHTPIVTGSDAEGAGQIFRVTTLDAKNPPLLEDGTIDYAQDFFGKATNLTVSGQLEGELGATALGEIYTFGPTFRAENSNTARHLAEFWMIESEMAFYELQDNMDLAEDFLKSLIKYALENCMDDLEFLSKHLQEEEKNKPMEERSMELIEKLRFVQRTILFVCLIPKPSKYCGIRITIKRINFISRLIGEPIYRANTNVTWLRNISKNRLS
jgi:asparaginyl-tRNA synthetase